MKILAIAAHPDDIEYGCGGTLVKYSRGGHKVYLLIMSEGEMGGQPEVRKNEQAKAAVICNVEDVFWGGYQDTCLPIDKEIITKIENIVHKIEPDFIFVHYLDDTHQDHRHLSQVAVSATRHIKNVLFYEGPSTQNFAPSIYVDISKYFKEKILSLRAHRSQVARTNIEGHNIVDIASSNAIFRGIQSKVKYAEAFQPLRLFINI